MDASKELRHGRLRGPYRKRLLTLLAQATADLKWTPGLLRLLIEELYVEDDIDTVLAASPQFDERRIPQIIAVAIALRHSWKVDDFYAIIRRLHVVDVID